jgi:hypothetical protein
MEAVAKHGYQGSGVKDAFVSYSELLLCLLHRTAMVDPPVPGGALVRSLLHLLRSMSLDDAGTKLLLKVHRLLPGKAEATGVDALLLCLLKHFLGSAWNMRWEMRWVLWIIWNLAWQSPDAAQKFSSSGKELPQLLVRALHAPALPNRSAAEPCPIVLELVLNVFFQLDWKVVQTFLLPCMQQTDVSAASSAASAPAAVADPTSVAVRIVCYTLLFLGQKHTDAKDAPAVKNVLKFLFYLNDRQEEICLPDAHPWLELQEFLRQQCSGDQKHKTSPSRSMSGRHSNNALHSNLTSTSQVLSRRCRRRQYQQRSL